MLAFRAFSVFIFHASDRVVQIFSYVLALSSRFPVGIIELVRQLDHIPEKDTTYYKKQQADHCYKERPTSNDQLSFHRSIIPCLSSKKIFRYGPPAVGVSGLQIIDVFTDSAPQPTPPGGYALDYHQRSLFACGYCCYYRKLLQPDNKGYRHARPLARVRVPSLPRTGVICRISEKEPPVVDYRGLLGEG